jgi:hypothetical protein
MIVRGVQKHEVVTTVEKGNAGDSITLKDVYLICA